MIDLLFKNITLHRAIKSTYLGFHYYDCILLCMFKELCNKIWGLLILKNTFWLHLASNEIKCKVNPFLSHPYLLIVLVARKWWVGFYCRAELPCFFVLLQLTVFSFDFQVNIWCAVAHICPFSSLHIHTQKLFVSVVYV